MGGLQRLQITTASMRSATKTRRSSRLLLLATSSRALLAGRICLATSSTRRFLHTALRKLHARAPVSTRERLSF
jgi:hypothetical protein